MCVDGCPSSDIQPFFIGLSLNNVPVGLEKNGVDSRDIASVPR